MVENNTIQFTKLDERAFAPTRTNTYDAGADLYAIDDVRVPSLLKMTINFLKSLMWGGFHDSLDDIITTKINTGIAIEIPDGEVGLLLDRSSVGSKAIKVFGGVMDSPYRGEYKICLLNLSFQDYYIKRGDKVAQLVIVPCRNYQFQETKQLSETARGSMGFGQNSGR